MCHPIFPLGDTLLPGNEESKVLQVRGIFRMMISWECLGADVRI